MSEELTRLRRISWLIGSIYVHGDFVAETANERELESLLRAQGTFWESLSEFAAQNIPTHASVAAPQPAPATTKERRAWEDGDGRWEVAFRNIVTILGGVRESFEIREVVEAVRALTGEEPEGPTPAWWKRPAPATGKPLTELPQSHPFRVAERAAREAARATGECLTCGADPEHCTRDECAPAIGDENAEWREFQQWFMNCTEDCDRDSAWTVWQASAAHRREGWQPIETAPKEEGKDIILLVDGVVKCGCWYVIPYSEQRDLDGRYIDQTDPDEGWCTRDDVGEQPTHWMPLPAAPAHGEPGALEQGDAL